ncbi:MAG: Blue-light-activated protein [bacterium ADurb.BinA186]|nr:MAG: Blue-light-activated protein [bacterium ADurb.BinA186]
MTMNQLCPSLLLAAIDASSGGITLADARKDDLPIIFVNQAFEQLTGYHRDEIIGRNCRFLQSKSGVQRGRKQIRQAIEKGESVTTIMRNFRKDGTPFLNEVSISPVFDEKGFVTHFIGIQKDVTQRIAAHKHQIHLERQLAESKKMETVGQLAAGLAHEINNSLMVISGYMQLLEQGESIGALTKNQLQRVSSAIERAKDITKKMLGFARKGSYEKCLFSINEILEESASLLGLIRKTGLKVTMEMEEGLWPIEGDRNQLTQSIINIGINSLDAMPDGGELRIKSSNIVKTKENLLMLNLSPGNYVHVQIRDSGCGMNKQQLEKAFDPFFTTKTVGKGTGLGLSMTYGVIKSHNGDINLESTLNKGTTVNIYLPAKGHAEC